jgi:hypothetical protein
MLCLTAGIVNWRNYQCTAVDARVAITRCLDAAPIKELNLLFQPTSPVLPARTTT